MVYKVFTWDGIGLKVVLGLVARPFGLELRYSASGSFTFPPARLTKLAVMTSYEPNQPHPCRLPGHSLTALICKAEMEPKKFPYRLLLCQLEPDVPIVWQN